MANTIYLIDFENVNSTGNLDFSIADETDEIILLYTKNAERISLDILKGLKAKLSVYKVPNGSQQLDMQLSSRLGFMIGRYGNSHHYTVISKDSDYARTIESWCEEGISVSQQPFLGKEPLLLPEKTETKEIEQVIEVKQKPKPKKETVKKKKPTVKKKEASANPKSELNNRIQKRFNKEYEPEVVGKIASIVVKEVGKQGSTRKVYTELVKTLKKETGLNVYRMLKAENFLR